MHGSDDENLKATGVKTNAGGQQFTLIKLTTEKEEKILEDEGKILEQTNKKNIELFLSTNCII